MQRNESKPSTRRDFVVVAAGAFVGVGGIFAVWPLLHQMSPNPATDRPEIIAVDLGRIAPGEEITVHWNRMPWIVRHRTREEIARAAATTIAALPDPLARNGSMPEKSPATDENRRDPSHPDWIVVSAVCSRDSVFLKPAFDADRAGRSEAWWCPVCASRYDAAGRVVAGPAPANLAVPRYTFVSPIRLEIGG